MHICVNELDLSGSSGKQLLSLIRASRRNSHGKPVVQQEANDPLPQKSRTAKYRDLHRDLASHRRMVGPRHDERKLARRECRAGRSATPMTLAEPGITQLLHLLPVLAQHTVSGP